MNARLLFAGHCVFVALVILIHLFMTQAAVEGHLRYDGWIIVVLGLIEIILGGTMCMSKATDSSKEGEKTMTLSQNGIEGQLNIPKRYRSKNRERLSQLLKIMEQRDLTDDESMELYRATDGPAPSKEEQERFLVEFNRKIDALGG